MQAEAVKHNLPLFGVIIGAILLFAAACGGAGAPTPTPTPDPTVQIPTKGTIKPSEFPSASDCPSLTGGRLLGVVAGAPVLLLTTTGHRTGKQRRFPG